MTAIQLYNQIQKLPEEMQEKVAQYVEKLLSESTPKSSSKERTPGLAKGMIVMKDNFDDPIEGFEPYM
ncbi:MAG: DUF2281 domain-containing protein [Bacteroidota bacterium]